MPISVRYDDRQDIYVVVRNDVEVRKFRHYVDAETFADTLDNSRWQSEEWSESPLAGINDNEKRLDELFSASTEYYSPGGEPVLCPRCQGKMYKRRKRARSYLCGTPRCGYTCTWPKLEFPRGDDLTGQRFGRWLVLRKAERHDNSRRRYWLCKCDCGVMREIRGSALETKQTTSCGCARAEASADLWKEPAAAIRMAHGGRPRSVRVSAASL
jgi:hypothetical protein